MGFILQLELCFNVVLVAVILLVAEALLWQGEYPF